MSSKFVSTKGIIIFPDKACNEPTKPLSKDLQNWVGKRVQDIFQGEDVSIKYQINFTVNANYEIAVMKINMKNISEPNAQLNSMEQR